VKQNPLYLAQEPTVGKRVHTSACGDSQVTSNNKKLTMDNQFAPQIWSDIYNFVGEFINPTTKDMKSFQTDVRYDIVTLTRLFDGNETKKVY